LKGRTGAGPSQRRLTADGGPPLEADAAGHVDLADHALGELRHRLADRRRAAALRAVLAHPLVLSGGGDQLPAFPDVVRAGLLNVNVLARLDRRDGDQRMRMVGRGDAHRVDVRIFHEPAVVGRGLALSLGPLLELGGPRGEHRLVDVAQGDHLGPLDALQAVDVVLPFAVEPDAADANLFVGASPRGVGCGGQNVEGSEAQQPARRRASHQEFSTVDAERHAKRLLALPRAG